MQGKLLEDLVVPICIAEISQQARLKHLVGTAFFVGTKGFFLTAAHVLRDAALHSGSTVGLVVKDPVDSSKSLFAPISYWEAAPEQFDVALGVVNFKPRNWFHAAAQGRLAGWADIAVLGYPEISLNILPNGLKIHIRTQKGYIQRVIEENEITFIQPHSALYEISFPIVAGMSGSPVFMPKGEVDVLYGICIGSIDSEIVSYENTLIEENGSEYRERRSRIHELGLAQIIEPLLSWKSSRFEIPLSDIVAN